MSAPPIIGISGYARSGKDTFAAALVEGREYEQRSFAQPIRDLLYAMNPSLENGLPVQIAFDAVGYERLKDISPEYRRLLKTLGTEGGREILGPNVWVDAAMAQIHWTRPAPGRPSFGLREEPKYVFADVRFHNEAQAIVDRGGIIVRIERDGVGPQDGHASETSMDDWSFDYVIRNNWTVAELRQRAFDVIDKECGRFPARRYHATACIDGPYARDRLAIEYLENGRELHFPSGTTMSTVDL